MTLLADYITREELATELKVTSRTIDKWAWLSKGPRKIKIGNRTYYHRQDVQAWIDSLRSAKEAA